MGGAGRVELIAADALGHALHVMSFHSGGTGARPRADASAPPPSRRACVNVPVEITETWRPGDLSKEYRQDSGGAGEHRGGLGQVMEIAAPSRCRSAISPTFDRVVFPGARRLGGLPGTAARSSSKSAKHCRPRRIPRFRPTTADRLDAGRGATAIRQAAGGEGRRGRGAGAGVEKAARELYGVALTADGAATRRRRRGSDEGRGGVGSLFVTCCSIS